MATFCREQWVSEGTRHGLGKRTSCSPTQASSEAVNHAQTGGNSVGDASEETFTDLDSLGRDGVVGRRRGKQAAARGSITHTHLIVGGLFRDCCSLKWIQLLLGLHYEKHCALLA